MLIMAGVILLEAVVMNLIWDVNSTPLMVVKGSVLIIVVAVDCLSRLRKNREALLTYKVCWLYTSSNFQE
jgi:ABC-type glucose/galactose transport system permease subunit